MAKFCISCGAALNEGARFCGECGAPVPSGNGATPGTEPEIVAIPEAEPPANAAPPPSPMVYEPPVASPPPTPPIEQEIGNESYSPIDEPEKSGPNWLLIGGGAGIVLLLLLYYLLFLRDDMATSLEDRVKPAAQTKAEEAQLVQLYAMTEANIRDAATAQGSTILGKLARGAAVSGTVIMGEDGTSEWLELPDGKGFVATVNLAETQPPQITKQLGDKKWTADKFIEIWSQPDSGGTLVDRVAAGTVLTLAGLTANDYIEIKLKKGGVGARIIALANGKPIAIAFDSESCSFGPEIDGMFSTMGDRLRAQYKALENKDYPTEEAREKALGAIEGKSSFQKLQRTYEGLTVTAIAQHYESQSVYFAEGPAQVIAALKGKGYKIGADGNFPSTDLYAGVGATAGEGRAYGKTDLGCGV
jgi:zinc-ribbon domain